MREAPNCAEKCEKRLIVRICAGNGLKCDNLRKTAKSAIPHRRMTLSLPLNMSEQLNALGNTHSNTRDAVMV